MSWERRAAASEKIGRAEISDKRYVVNQLSGQASSESERGGCKFVAELETEEEARGLQNAGFLLSATSLDTTIFT